MIAQFVMDQILASTGRRYWVLRKIRKTLLRFQDPLLNYRLNGKIIRLNLSHDLPYAIKTWPTVSANLTRLGRFIRRELGSLKMIDVGANIGDSYYLVEAGAEDRFLLIDGEPHYFELMKLNTPNDGTVVRIMALLSSEPGVARTAMVSEKGTARIVRGADATLNSRYTTLDIILRDYPDFLQSNLCKIDVDGYDSKVIMGAREFLKSRKPVIMFEHHPRLLAQVGENEHYLFAELNKLGYGQLIFYDIQGYLIGKVPSAAEGTLRDLVCYAKCKDDYCFDVCCFHDDFGQLRESFLSEERQYYRENIEPSDKL